MVSKTISGLMRRYENIRKVESALENLTIQRACKNDGKCFEYEKYGHIQVENVQISKEKYQEVITRTNHLEAGAIKIAQNMKKLLIFAS